MELGAFKGPNRVASGARSRAKLPKHPPFLSSTTSSSSSSSRGLSERRGIRMLMHRDPLTCHFLGSLPRPWLKKCCQLGGQQPDRKPRAAAASSSSFSCPADWLFSRLSLSSPAPPSLHAPPVPRGVDGEPREQPGRASLQTADGLSGSPRSPGMTSVPRGSSSQPFSYASSLGFSLRHNNSGWARTRTHTHTTAHTHTHIRTRANISACMF